MIVMEGAVFTLLFGIKWLLNSTKTTGSWPSREPRLDIYIFYIYFSILGDSLFNFSDKITSKIYYYYV